MQRDRTDMQGDRTAVQGDGTAVQGDRTVVRGDGTAVHSAGRQDCCATTPNQRVMFLQHQKHKSFFIPVILDDR